MTGQAYPLEEGHFSHLYIDGGRFELKIDGHCVTFGLDTAAQIEGILRGYLEDRDRQMRLYLEITD